MRLDTQQTGLQEVRARIQDNLSGLGVAGRLDEEFLRESDVGWEYGLVAMGLKGGDKRLEGNGEVATSEMDTRGTVGRGREWSWEEGA